MKRINEFVRRSGHALVVAAVLGQGCAPEAGPAPTTPPAASAAASLPAAWGARPDDVSYATLPAAVRQRLEARLGRIQELTPDRALRLGPVARPLRGPIGETIEYYEVPLLAGGELGGAIVASATHADYPIVGWNADGHADSAGLLARAAAQGVEPRLLRRMGSAGLALEGVDGRIVMSDGLRAIVDGNGSRASFADVARDSAAERAGLAAQVAAAWSAAPDLTRAAPSGGIIPLKDGPSGDGRYPNACRLRTRTPRYDQPVRGGTAAGCGPTAWAILFGWGSRAADEGTAYGGYTWSWQPTGGYSVAPTLMSTTNPSDEVAVEIYKLRSQFIYGEGGGETSVIPSEMGKVYDYIQSISNKRVFTKTVFSSSFIVDDDYNRLARGEICDLHQPVIVGTGSGSTLHYPVVEAYNPATSEFYFNMGHGGGDDYWGPLHSWFFGEMHGQVPLYHSWEHVFGGAQDVGVGLNGDVWTIGNNHGGNSDGSPYKYNKKNKGWDVFPGAARRIAVAPDGSPWVVNDLGIVWHWDGDSWSSLPGRARDIAVDMYGEVLAIGQDSSPAGDGAIMKWDPANRSWQIWSGAGVRIAVADRQVWVVNNAGYIYRTNQGVWENVPGRGIDIGSGGAGLVWALDQNGTPMFWDDANFQFSYPAGSSLTGATSIAVAPDGYPWVTLADQNIYSMK